MSNRVPHCKECNRCQYTDLFYKDYYCCKENEPFTVFGSLGVDSPPKTSPRWCPKREEKSKMEDLQNE